MGRNMSQGILSYFLQNSFFATECNLTREENKKITFEFWGRSSWTRPRFLCSTFHCCRIHSLLGHSALLTRPPAHNKTKLETQNILEYSYLWSSWHNNLRFLCIFASIDVNEGPEVGEGMEGDLDNVSILISFVVTTMPPNRRNTWGVQLNSKKLVIILSIECWFRQNSQWWPFHAHSISKRFFPLYHIVIISFTRSAVDNINCSNYASTSLIWAYCCFDGKAQRALRFK